MAGKITNFFKMASKLKLNSLVTFYRLKYLTKEDKDIHRLNLRNGLALNVNKNQGDLTTLFEVFVDEDYKFGENSNEQINILDIGANVGYFSLYISKKFPNAKIFSFEPFPDTFVRLNEHFSGNNVKNVTPFNLAVSDFDGKSKFYSFEWTGCNTMIDGEFDESQSRVTEVDCVKFEKLKELTGANGFDYAKIDCEGSEYPMLLNSSDESIKAVRKYIIEVHNSDKYSKEDLMKRFSSLGYNIETTDNLLIAEI
ncbi:MAG TPA: FkbM family methyltransferase [Ignavibacteria bacterium]|nr:FkbM family methyltransferase [Ignavibacteria bacterium]HMQ99167.1 FkbM family methyltransferase [Ignavibacteria bacterium]